MDISIKIDEQRVTELAEQLITEQMVSEHWNYISRETERDIRDSVDKAIKEHIYSRKDEIIERVVERATREIVKKGLPKMLERLGNAND